MRLHLASIDAMVLCCVFWLLVVVCAEEDSSDDDDDAHSRAKRVIILRSERSENIQHAPVERKITITN